MFISFKHYFIAVGITFIATKAAETEAVCQYIVALMGGNAARWIDKLKVQSNTPNNLLEFEMLFMNQYTLLDNKNIAWDKLHELWYCGSAQEYITAFDNVVVA